MENSGKNYPIAPILSISTIVIAGLILSQIVALIANTSEANQFSFYCIAAVFYPLAFWCFGIQFQPTIFILNACHSLKKLSINSVIYLGLTILFSKHGFVYNFSDLKTYTGPLFFYLHITTAYWQVLLKS